MDTTIRADALTTYDVSPDGTRVRFHVRNADGGTAALELPAECLNQLLMTLPRIIQTAMRRNEGGDSLRLVYPMDDFRLELGEVDPQGARQYILTLRTGGTFGISFALPAAQLAVLAQTVIDQVMESEQVTLEPLTLDS